MEKEDPYVGKIFGIYEILEKTELKDTSKHTKYKMRCIYCGFEITQRIKRAKESTCCKHWENKKKRELEQWIAEQHRCERCGKIMTEKFGPGRFCSRFCANAKKHSPEERKKIGNSLKEYAAKHKGDKQRDENGNIIKYTACVICGKEFEYTKRKNKTCSRECRDELYRKQQRELLEKGEHKGWKRRNEMSYAEKFWCKVLQNNNIDYEHDFAVTRLEKGHHYLLDFKIREYIDLEIDGKQHKYPDRAEHDKIRDKELTNKGYKIYRVPYVNPKNTEKVKQQIDDFLKWYEKNK